MIKTFELRGWAEWINDRLVKLRYVRSPAFEVANSSVSACGPRTNRARGAAECEVAVGRAILVPVRHDDAAHRSPHRRRTRRGLQLRILRPGDGRVRDPLPAASRPRTAHR